MTGGSVGGILIGVMAETPSPALSIETFLEEARRLFWFG